METDAKALEHSQAQMMEEDDLLMRSNKCSRSNDVEAPPMQGDVEMEGEGRQQGSSKINSGGELQMKRWIQWRSGFL